MTDQQPAGIQVTDPARCTMCGSPLPSRSRSPLYCSPTCQRKARRRRIQARKPLPAPPPPSRCTRCGKTACPTEDAAKAAKRAIEIQTGRTNEVRYYQCDDGWWHWTRVDATLDGFRARQAGAR